MNNTLLAQAPQDRDPRSGDLHRFYASGRALTLWDDKDAWKLRAAVEGDFYSRLLTQERVRHVLDLAAASGFHAIHLSRAGFAVTATDGLQEFVLAGIQNQIQTGTNFPFIHTLWSDLHPQLFGGTQFDALLCLGGSLHHTDMVGVRHLFRNAKTLLRSEGIFVVEQRNYERLFRERPTSIDHPCGWVYTIEYREPRTILFHLTDQIRGIDTLCECSATFERELLNIGVECGFRLKDTYYDYGSCLKRDGASWIQFVFSVENHHS